MVGCTNNGYGLPISKNYDYRHNTGHRNSLKIRTQTAGTHQLINKYILLGIFLTHILRLFQFLEMSNNHQQF